MFDFLRRFSGKTIQKKTGDAVPIQKPIQKVSVPQTASPTPGVPLSLFLGRVTHYYPKIQVGIVRVEKGKLTMGDLVYVQGAKTRFKQRVSSIEFNHRKVKSVGPGYEIGIQFGARVREGDEVYLVQGGV